MPKVSTSNCNYSHWQSALTGEFGLVDHMIPWQIDHQQTITGYTLNNYQSFT